MDVSAQWHKLGLQLKVRIGTLNRIRTQFSDPEDQLMEMLKTWLNNSDSTSWKTLTDALRSRSVGASRLAGDLEAKYCLVPERTEVDRSVSASDSDPEAYVTPPSEPVIDAPTSQPQMADMQNLESKFFRTISLNAMK